MNLDPDAQLLIGGVSASELAAEYGTPLYVYDADSVRAAFSRVRNAMPYCPLKVHYACVTNANIAILRLIRALGGGIHANTWGDAVVAMRASFTPGEIVYSGSNLGPEDMGKIFVQNARSIFAGEKAMRFAGIDIDLPFDAQEVARESFDIVTAVNVLHVAEDLPATLREIHRTLRTPGYLVCAEGSPPRPGSRWRLDLVFGFLPGWWDVATNSQLRPSPGFLFPSQWRQLLHACGFDVVEAMPGESWFDRPCRGGLIVAAKLPCGRILAGASRTRSAAGVVRVKQKHRRFPRSSSENSKAARAR